MTEGVTDRTPYEPIPEMSLLGYAWAALTLLVLLPLLPFLAAVWVYDRLTG